MNYIYDIVLNFNKDYYDFFEWGKRDTIINIKKIPLFVVDDLTFYTFKDDNVKVSKDFINVIKDKTYTYRGSKLEMASLISNGKEVMGLLFNNNGVLIKKSSLTLDEEEEVLEEIVNNEIYKIDIIKNTKIRKENTLRSIKEKKKFLIKYINNEKNKTNLRYLFYDYFEREESSIDKIKNILISEIKNNWNKKFNTFYDTVKLFSKIKN